MNDATNDATDATPQPAPPAGAAGGTTSTGRPVPRGRLVLLRHGETQWSRDGRHTGLTDIALTERGEELARRTRPLLDRFDIVTTLCSPLERARRTAELVGLRVDAIDENLVEWDYGSAEGRTTAQIREELGYDWTIWEDGVTAGETPGETIEDVSARARAVIDRALPDLEHGDVALVAHGHLLRVLAATWLRQAPRFGAHLLLDAGSVSALGYERENPAIEEWNTRAEHLPQD